MDTDPASGEQPPEEDGPIEPAVPTDQVRQTPYPLPNDFEWATLDLEDDKEVRNLLSLHGVMLIGTQNKEVYDLLSANYVEDSDASFRFQYTAEFLRWSACLSPSSILSLILVGHAHLPASTRAGTLEYALSRTRNLLRSSLRSQYGCAYAKSTCLTRSLSVDAN